MATRWTLDTCDCVLTQELDEAAGLLRYTKAQHRIPGGLAEGPCSLHASPWGEATNPVPCSIVGLTDSEADNGNPVWERCRRVGRVWQEAKKARPALPESYQEKSADGKGITEHMTKRYVGDVLEVSVPALTTGQKSALQASADNRFGPGRVRVV